MRGDLQIGTHALDVLSKTDPEVATFGHFGSNTYALFYQLNDTCNGYLTGVSGASFLINSAATYPTMVGIGTTVANATLDVYGTIACSNLILYGSTASFASSSNIWNTTTSGHGYVIEQTIGVNSQTATAWFTVAPALLPLSPPSALSSLPLMVVQNAAAEPRLTVTSNGLVGVGHWPIGATPPMFDLDVHDNLNLWGALYACNILRMDFSTETTYLAPTVGIGMSNPQSLLHVMGTSKPHASGTLVAWSSATGSPHMSNALNAIDGNAATAATYTAPSCNAFMATNGTVAYGEWIDLVAPTPLYLNHVIARTNATHVEVWGANPLASGTPGTSNTTWHWLGVTSNGLAQVGAFRPYASYRVLVNDGAYLQDVEMYGTPALVREPERTVLFENVQALGIGVTVPKFTLDVNGDINYMGGMYIRGSQAAPWLETDYVSMGSNNYGTYSRSVYVTNTLVGIGTDAPKSNLHVVGDVLVEGTVFASSFKQLFSFNETLTVPPYNFAQQQATATSVVTVTGIPGKFDVTSGKVEVYLNRRKMAYIDAANRDYAVSAVTYNTVNSTSGFTLTFVTSLQVGDVVDVVIWYTDFTSITAGTLSKNFPVAPQSKRILAAAAQTVFQLDVPGGDYTLGDHVVLVHVNGQKLARVSANLSDYTVVMFYTGSATRFWVMMAMPLNAGDVVDITVWATQTIVIGGSYLYKADLVKPPVYGTVLTTGAANAFILSTPGVFASSISSVMINGIKLVEAFDYTLAPAFNPVTNETDFTLTLLQMPPAGYVLDMTVWPASTIIVGFAGEITDNNKMVFQSNAMPTATATTASNIFVTPRFQVSYAPTSLVMDLGFMAFAASAGHHRATVAVQAVTLSGTVTNHVSLDSTQSYFQGNNTYQLFPSSKHIYKPANGVSGGYYRFFVELDSGATFDSNTMANVTVCQSTLM